MEIAGQTLPSTTHLQTNLALLLQPTPDCRVIFLADRLLDNALRLFFVFIICFIKKFHHLHIFARSALVDGRSVEWTRAFGEGTQTLRTNSMATAHDHGYSIGAVVCVEADFAADLQILGVLHEIDWLADGGIDT